MDQRKHGRIVTDRELSCRYRGAEFPIFVYNLSADGCMALLQGRDVVEGDKLSIDFQFDGYADGRIIWRHGPFLGIAFAHKLDFEAVRRLDAVGCDPLTPSLQT